QRARGFLAQVGLEPIRGAPEVAAFVVRDSPERESGNGGLVTAGKSATNRTESLLGTVDGAGEVSGVAEKKQIAARLATAEGLEVVRFGRRKSLRIMCVESKLSPRDALGHLGLLGRRGSAARGGVPAV